MGRKIPGKKHRGIKDPDKQRAKRWAELKTRINEPPGNIDEQAIPKSLARVMHLKEAVKSGKFTKKKKSRKSKNNLITLGPQNIARHPNAKPEKCVPVFNQKPGESTHRFVHRVDHETNLFLKETIFEQKFNVEVKRDPRTGHVEGIQQAPKDEIDELVKLKMKHQNTKKKKKKSNASNIAPKLTKVQKRREKLKLKREKKLQNKSDDSKGVRETVQFGDIVHAPPNLKTKFTKPEGTERKRDLLLNSIYAQNDDSRVIKTNKTCLDKTGKRKDLPSAERRLLEKQQTDVIAAYRLLKTKNSTRVK